MMVLHKILAASLIAAVAALSVAFVQDPQAPKKPTRLAGPTVSFIGSNSKIAKGRYVKVTNEADWAKLWLEHIGKPADDRYNWFYNESNVPAVDFERCVVVAVFQGDTWNSAGVRVVEVLADGNRTKVRFDDNGFQTSGPDGGGVRVQPFGMFVLARPKGPIALEENVQGLINRPAKWQLRAEF